MDGVLALAIPHVHELHQVVAGVVHEGVDLLPAGRVHDEVVFALIRAHVAGAAIQLSGVPERGQERARVLGETAWGSESSLRVAAPRVQEPVCLGPGSLIRRL
jgi:hypothetical protein